MQRRSKQNRKALDSHDPRDVRMCGLDLGELSAQLRFVIMLADRVGLAFHGCGMDVGNGI
jgi:hypothetical protein